MTDNVFDFAQYRAIVEAQRAEEHRQIILRVMAVLGLIMGPRTWCDGFKAILRASTSRHAYGGT